MKTITNPTELARKQLEIALDALKEIRALSVKNHTELLKIQFEKSKP